MSRTGKALERVLGKLARAVGYVTPAARLLMVATESDEEHNPPQPRPPHGAYSLSASSNDTASNLAGAGRTLGILYSRGGLALESTLGRLAHKAGFGPQAAWKRLWGLISKQGQDDLPAEAQQSYDAELSRRCKQLTKYVTLVNLFHQYLNTSQLPCLYSVSSPSTQIQALRSILNILTTGRQCEHEFQKPDTMAKLTQLPDTCADRGYFLDDTHAVQFLTQAALQCLENNESTEAWKQVDKETDKLNEDLSNIGVWHDACDFLVELLELSRCAHAQWPSNLSRGSNGEQESIDEVLSSAICEPRHRLDLRRME